MDNLRYNGSEGGDSMDIRVMRYFLALCETGSVTAAARALNITQPALSRQITAKYYEFGLCMSGARYVTGTTNPYLIYRYYISRYTSIGTFKYYIS